MRVFAIAFKELRQLRRDRLTLAMIVGIPLMQTMLFGYAINFDVRGLNAAVLDEANTSASRAWVADLQASGIMKIVEHVRSSKELSSELRAGRVSMGVHIPVDFERRRLETGRPAAQIIIDGAEPSLEGIGRGLSAIPLPRRDGIYSPDERIVEIRTEFNPEKRTAMQIVPALIGAILSMTMTMFTAVAIVRERERGNLELLITTPVKSIELTVGKLLPYIFIGLIQSTLVLGLGAVLFDVPVQGSLVSVYMAALIFIAATLALGLLISTVAQTQAQAFQMSLFTLLPSIMLSGFMFPFDGMPVAIQYLAQVLPLTHFNELIRGIVLRGASLTELQRPLIKLLVFTVVIVGAATLRFHKRLD